MDVRQLAVFRAVIESRLVTRAALALGVSQPAVSAQLTRMEAELGFPLFSRVGRQLEPTPEALVLYDSIAGTLEEVDRVQDVVEAIRQGRRGQLTLFSHPWAAVSLLPKGCAELLKSRPDVRLRIVTRTSDALQDLMRTGVFDLGMVEPPVESTLTRIASRRFRCVAVLPQEHELAEHACITIAQLADKPFIAPFRGHGVHHDIARAFDSANAAWNIRAEAQFGITICSMIANGTGVGICDPFSAKIFEGRGVAVRRLEPLIDYAIALVRPALPPTSILTQAFARVLLDQIDTDWANDLAKPPGEHDGNTAKATASSH